LWAFPARKRTGGEIAGFGPMKTYVMDSKGKSEVAGAQGAALNVFGLLKSIDNDRGLHIGRIDGGYMETVTVSPKYQIVIPREIREALGIRPGAKVHVLQYENRIEYIPVKEMKKMRGFLKGIETTVKGEKDRL